MSKIAVLCFFWCVVLSGGSPLSNNGEQDTPAKSSKTSGVWEEFKEEYTETLENEADNQENVLTQLLGDYDKVKAVSEGSDCQCKCVVRPLSRTACKRIEEGNAKVNDFYTVETVTSGPGCKCACIAPPSALNPCEGDFRFKKLQEAEKDGIKLSTVIELLEGAFYGLDLLKMHSVTTKLVHRMETLEKVALQNRTEKKEHLKGNTKLNHISKKENSSTTSPIETKKQLTDLGSILQSDAAAAYNHKEKYEDRFAGEAVFSKPPLKGNEGVRLEPPTELLERLESSQTKPVSRPAIIRGITYYKANPIEEDNDTDDQPEDDFPSGDGAVDLLIEDQLIKHIGTLDRTVEIPEPVVRPPTTAAPEVDAQDNMETTQALTTTATAMESTAAPSITTELPSTYITTTTATTTASSTPSTRITTVMTVPPNSTSTPVQDTISATTTVTAATTIPEPSTSKAAPITTDRPTTAKTTTSIASVLLNTTRPPELTIPRQRVNINGDESQENMGDEAQTSPGVCKDTLSTISDPVIHNTYGRNEGAWMKDPKSKEDKIYVTNYYYGNTLVEFRNMENFKQGRWTNSYKLPYNWIGTGHVVYNGAFYYNRAFSRDIIKYDLKQRYVAAWAMMHDAVFEETTPWKWKGHSDIDFAVDENGLWIIYPAIDDEGFQQELIVLSKLNTADLTIQKETTWRTGLRKDFYGNCFIVCGVLYAVDSYNHMNATISYAFDTHTNTQGVPRLPFVNNFSYTTQIDYNPKERVLYAWDRGHQVTYGVMFAY
ncbi:olfactomedin-like protein 2B [Acipenser oxyrinchus oxyrinchus]|uniref:Olfactomedin-like protein 2B n=1 Tax=Acipenser oxyrinchus oxyrinchus TaxID=40147 RepID=A0AAD8D7M7_ACIOX|nr:olfactomedin-like protein 2B [Acipenser oxyrinchus oxyrinchus]